MAFAYRLKQNGPDKSIYVTDLAQGDSFPALFSTPANINVVGMLDCEWCDVVRIRLLTMKSNVTMRFLWYLPPDIIIKSGGASVEEYPSQTFNDWISSTTGDGAGKLDYTVKARTNETSTVWTYELHLQFVRTFNNLTLSAGSFTPPILGRYLYPVVTNGNSGGVANYLLTVERTFRPS